MNCTLWCAAYLLGISTDALIKEIGHDGTKVLWSEYNDDRRLRGFSLAEIQDCFWLRGKMLAPIFVYPMIAPDYDAKPHRIWTTEQAAERYHTMVSNKQAIIIGKLIQTGVMHAVVWDEDKYIDPRNPVPQSILTDFAPQEIYLVCKL